jgi:phosphopantothenoylcysteine decarboxylase/phosphopantothenate--cysteine ligase
MHLLVTAGPTREFLDPVRFLSNRSSGKMGYALAAAGIDRGHTVTLISGPVSLKLPPGVKHLPVISAEDMLNAVLADFPSCDVLLMCAAVADWRPKHRAMQKLKKDLMCDTLALERTPDILKAVQEIRQDGQLVVGFAAETEDVSALANRKRIDKGLDLIVANDVSRSDAGFEADTNIVTLISATGADTLPLLPKRDVADQILNWVEKQGVVVGCSK